MVEQLLALGFGHVGEWRASDSYVHRAPWIRHKPGVYVFVVGGTVRYVGMSARLHSRLRRYRNRCRRVGVNPLRDCHQQILATLSTGRVLSVYARVLDGASDPTPPQFEKELISKFRPKWNG